MYYILYKITFRKEELGLSNCILELKLLTQPWHEHKLEHIFRCSEKMYNAMVRHAIKCLNALNNDSEYPLLLSSYRQRANKQDKAHISRLLRNKVLSYGLSEYAFHAYMAKMKRESYQGVLDIDTAQKIATRVWKATADVLYGNGKKIHFKKNGTLDSIESKKNISGIKFDKDTLTCKFKGMVIPVKMRQNDTYAQEMLTHKICYCRIVRKPFKTGYKYFLQLILDGVPPVKFTLGSGNVGIDMGTSSLSAIGKEDGIFVAHGNNMSKTNNQTVDKYNKLILRLTRKLERQRRLNNPLNYNNDGTIKKGTKHWVRTKSYYQTLFALKDAYRRKACFIKQQHNKTANKVIALGDRFITEPMDWKALQKKSSKTEKSDKTVTINKKDGSTRTVKKSKKKRRYGKSLGNHSPGLCEKTLIQKLSYVGKQLEYVKLNTYRASQYNPETNTYNKCDLNTRWKIIFNQLIQRDLLSAFLLQNPLEDLEAIDIVTVQKKINQFVVIHDKIINELKEVPNLPKCMGIQIIKIN